MKYSIGDLLHDILYVAFIGLIVGVFFLPTQQPCATNTSVVIEEPDTVYVEAPVKKKEALNPNHVTLHMLKKQGAPYPLLAYTTVIFESGWSHNKSYLAEIANNNLGMMVSRKRFNCATIKDTSAIAAQLDLYFGVDYGIVYYGNTVATNVQGDTLVGINNKWAIFLSPEDCAKDIAEYQQLYVKPEHAVSPYTYIKRLRALNYFTASDEACGYTNKWLKIYKKLENTYAKSNNVNLIVSNRNNIVNSF